MNDLTNNSQFTLLMTRITELTGNRPYILALEDFDRFLFITANTRERFNNREGIDALFRPGRIDKEIQLDYVDKQQLERMVSHFAEVDLELPTGAVPKQLTPVKVISVLQQYVGRDQGELEQDVKSWEFWSELQKEDPSTSTAVVASNRAIESLQQRIRKKQQTVTRYNRNLSNTERGVANIAKTKEQQENAQEQLKKMRLQLAAKKRKIRADAKKAAQRGPKKRPRTETN